MFQLFYSTLLESDRAARGRSLFDKKEEKEITREKGNTYFAFIGCLSFRTDPTGKRNEKKGKRKISIACARKRSRFSDFIEASREKKEKERNRKKNRKRRKRKNRIEDAFFGEWVSV